MLPHMVFASQPNVCHRFMLISSTDQRFDQPTFYNSYEDAFYAMICELASEMEIDPEILLEEFDGGGVCSDECSYSFAATSAWYYHHDCRWEIFCLAIESTADVNISSVENWPDEDIASCIYDGDD